MASTSAYGLLEKTPGCLNAVCDVVVPEHDPRVVAREEVHGTVAAQRLVVRKGIARDRGLTEIDAGRRLRRGGRRSAGGARSNVPDQAGHAAKPGNPHHTGTASMTLTSSLVRHDALEAKTRPAEQRGVLLSGALAPTRRGQQEEIVVARLMGHVAIRDHVLDDQQAAVALYGPPDVAQHGEALGLGPVVQHVRET